MKALRRLLMLALLPLPPVALAGLPLNAQLPVPRLPHTPLPVDVNQTASTVTDRVAQPLQDLRRLHVRKLLRARSAVLEADPLGSPVVRREVLAFSPLPHAMDKAIALGFTVVRERQLRRLDARVVVLRAPERMSTHRALRRLRLLDPQGAYDFNHIYVESGAQGAAVNLPTNGTLVPLRTNLRIGLVDGGVDVVHPALASVKVHQYGCGEKPVPSAHGTAVASLIAGNATAFRGAAPGAELFAADIYCDRPTGGAMDDIADAIAWIVGHQVPVINVSLVGPRNVLLEKVVRAATLRGHLIVAAVGNDGPAAAPLYPASYPEVVGVTAVDTQHRVLLEAGRGRQVDFAAPGADMVAAAISQEYTAVRGTSFAAPIVAGLLAAHIPRPDQSVAAGALTLLSEGALDLGARGLDEIYGNGLVGVELRTSTRPAVAGNK